MATSTKTASKPNAKFAKKNFVDAEVVRETPKPEWRHAADQLDQDMERCSFKRRMVAYGLGLLAAAGTVSGMSHLTAYLMIGAAMLTASSFVTMMVYFIGLVLTIYAGLNSFTTVFRYVVSSRPEHHWAWVKGKLSFGKDDDIVPEAA